MIAAVLRTPRPLPRPTIARALAAVVWLGVAQGCGGDSNLAEGATCTSSTECANGLLCDFGKTPHVCAKSETISHDMAMRLGDASVHDLAGRDLKTDD
jgi:hypothetical protein